MGSIVTTFASILIVCLVAIALQPLFFFFFSSSPISPESLVLPLRTPFPPNNHLQKVIKLGQGTLEKAEDVCVDDKAGVLYTATRDGWIKRLHQNGTWEDWNKIHSHHTLLGMTITRAGHLIVCDTDQGLLKVSEDGVTVLTSHVNGDRISFADDVIEAPDGSLYFSVASTKFGLHEWYLDVLEAKPHGQLLKYDPSTNETSIVLDGLCFPNGVAVSLDQEYLVVCETWKYRCLKYWLKEELKGGVEVFIDNLPGGPDNINLAPDGSFWIAQLQLTSRRLEFVHTSKAFKYLLAAFPKLIEHVKGLYKRATVINVGNDGKIIKVLDDPTGQVMSFVTSAVEFDRHLYLGSLGVDFIGKLALESV